MLLKVGSNGDDVKKLQEKLGLTTDGAFGPGTESAVKAWQSKNGLNADGVVGDGTWGKLFGAETSVTTSATGKLELGKLSGHIPSAILSLIPTAFEKYEVNTVLRAAHFLGQIAHESGDFTIKTESLYYTTPQVIVNTWPSRFNLNGAEGKKDANKYIKNQELLAESLYEGRMGNVKPGDGFRFRGAGFLQLTGREAFEGYAKYLGKTVEETADLIRGENFYSLDAALWEYTIQMKLNPVADQGLTDEIIKKITRIINGGYTGLPERTKKVKAYYAILA